LLYYLTTRTLKGRYRQMALGPLWSVIQPLVNMVIYSVIFGVIAKLPSNGVPYPVFSYVALLPWDFYSDSINAGSGSLVGSTSLISKVYFPRLILPFSQVISSLYDFALSFVFLIALLIFYGIRPTWGILLLPLFLAIAAMLGLGVGLVVAGPTVRYRDIRNLLGYVMRIWMYATPVVYSASLVPPQWLTLYQLNPMYAVIEGFRWALVGTAPPPAWTVAWAFIISIVLFVVGMYLFRRSERDIVDVL
jgi:homopolymeric O-antigen transport system permease protein